LAAKIIKGLGFNPTLKRTEKNTNP